MGSGQDGHSFASLLLIVESVQVVFHGQLQSPSLYASVQTARAMCKCPALLTRQAAQVTGGWTALG